MVTNETTRQRSAIDGARRRALGLLAAATAAPFGLARAQSAPTTARASREVAATVIATGGSTILTRPGLLATPVRTGTELRSGDRLRTGADGSLRLRFADEAVVALQPSTTFVIEEYAFGAERERSFLQLLKGSLRYVSGAIGKRDRDDFRLRTPTATVGIRGTEFTAEESDCPGGRCAQGVQPGLVVGVISGRVVVTTQAGSVEVPPGAVVRVSDSNAMPQFTTPAPQPRPARPAPARPRSGGGGATPPP